MHAAPAVSCAKNCALAHTSIQVSGNTPTSPAQWLYGLLRALPGGADLSCHRRLRDSFPPTFRQQRGVRTTRLDRTLRRFRPARSRTPDAKASITPPAQRFVTIAKRPSCGPRMARTRASDLPDVTSGIFLISGLDMISDNQNDLPVGLICRGLTVVARTGLGFWQPHGRFTPASPTAFVRSADFGASRGTPDAAVSSSGLSPRNGGVIGRYD